MEINWDLCGHNKTKNFFESVIETNSLTHAYLLYGSSGIGKFMFVKQLATYFYCQNEIKPCFECSYCKQIKNNIFPDFVIIDLLEDKKNITIEQIREFQVRFSKKSFLGIKKIAIINNADKLSLGATNSLLKTLEEPSSDTIIFLIATSLENILDTIKSRCQLVKFQKVNKNDIKNHIISLGADENLAVLISSAVNGQIGNAITFFNNPELWTEYLEKVESLKSLFGMTIIERFKVVEKMAKEKNINNIVDDLEILANLTRDILYLKIKENNKIVNVIHVDTLSKISENYSLEKLKIILLEINKTIIYLKQNSNSKLSLENLMLKL